MLINVNALQNFKLKCNDGDIGTVKQFYFDDHHWTIRYLVAETGDWLSSRQVLVSPYAIVGVNVESKHLILNVSKKQIEDSPSLDTDKPVSRQFEQAYYGYYGLPIYWVGPFMWGEFPDLTRNPTKWEKEVQKEKGFDPNLRSTLAISGHSIHALDGELGHVRDFVVDDLNWAIRYIVVDAGPWWKDQKVIISPQWIQKISWPEKAVYLNVTREKIRLSPAYSEDALISRDYESRLHIHYDKKAYWCLGKSEK